MIKAVAKISGDDYNVVVKTYSFVRFSFLCRSKNPEKLMFFEVFKEAQTGFEPVDTGVADHCLTTWLMNQRAGSFTTSQLCGKKNKLIQ